MSRQKRVITTLKLSKNSEYPFPDPTQKLTWAMSHLRAFVANQVLSRIRALLGLICPDFYSDIEDFTQILCRYLPKKLAAKTSGGGCLLVGMKGVGTAVATK